MTLPAIRAVGVSKKYALGGRVPYLTLRETIMAAARFKRRARPDGSQEHWALKDVNFEVQRGEVVGIIGRNGAGKSTLLKVLSRITDPTTGRVEIRGRVASLLEVGTGFHPELTGRENVSLNGAILGMRRAEITRKFDEIVAFAEVEKFIDTPVKYYSSGMYLRLAFAVAAHFESEILIVDEVLAVGDQAFQQRCLGKMGDAANSGRTVLLVSHNMAAVESLCERAMLLSGGAIVAEGRVDEVVRRYATLGTSVLDESLADRTDRRGTGTLRFESLRLYVEGGDQHGLYSGCEAVVRLGCCSRATAHMRAAR
jgi:lipopolysaccharide transport system ATP-binding protein